MVSIYIMPSSPSPSPGPPHCLPRSLPSLDGDRSPLPPCLTHPFPFLNGDGARRCHPQSGRSMRGYKLATRTAASSPWVALLHHGAEMLAALPPAPQQAAATAPSLTSCGPAALTPPPQQTAPSVRNWRPAVLPPPP
ncbi:hypothetical protein PVAP13_5NG357581 [Panicum virgatum]|uniref:Uncharacterized protein n=1 Tax=Panicum virgatum TaxID=38727 RepID=A0A8T0RWD1_PANVG|nr:hypothetical protein PVAP13_5NG357581 [Panicum virgatum]